jgi:hypothetical protein
LSPVGLGGAAMNIALLSFLVKPCLKGLPVSML